MSTRLCSFGDCVFASAPSSEGIRCVKHSAACLLRSSEVSGDCEEAGAVSDSNGKFWGTPAEYRGMWRRTRQLFDAANVSNVVWAMDYSVQATRPG